MLVPVPQPYLLTTRLLPACPQNNNINFKPPDRLLSYLPLAHIFDRCVVSSCTYIKPCAECSAR